VDILNLLEQAHDMVLHSVERLPVLGWSIPGVYGAWSVKDTIAHLTSCEYVLLDMMMDAKNITQRPTLNRWLQDRESFASFEVNRRQHKTVESLLDEYREVHIETIIQIIRLNDDLLRRIAWYGADCSLEQFIANTYYHHKRTLAEHIAAFRDRMVSAIPDELANAPRAAESQWKSQSA
jgi:hypothetical protein